MYEFLFYSALLAGVVIVYHHALYPVLLKRLARRAEHETTEPNDTRQASDLPFITVVIPCYNEADVIAEKVRNFSFIDYPTDRYSVLFVNDGSTDATAERFQQVMAEPLVKELPLKLIHHARNRGKVAILNETIQNIPSGLVVLSDTSALISSDAFLRLAQHMRNPKVGVVAATYRILNPGSEGEEKYWQYQTTIKQCESALGAAIGVHGALYCFRRHAFTPLPADTINDDFILPMEIVAHGYQCMYDPEIIAVELEQASLDFDHRRRLRISAGNVQQSLRLLKLLNPRFGMIAFNFLSGKFLRTWMPFIMLYFLVASTLLAFYQPYFAVLAGAQYAAYGLAALRELLPARAWRGPVNLLHYLVSGHVSNGVGAVAYLLGRQRGGWQRTRVVFNSGCYVPRSIRFAKRLFDVVVSLILLVVSLPLWPFIALAIRLESPGPVLFRQLRIGRSMPDHTALFQMIKFRSMVSNAEQHSGAVWAAKNDCRITRVGNFLRKTRLDELPQLINVIRGEMSLVGPRPERPGISRKLDQAIPFYAERTYNVAPGVTGLAQVNQGYDTCLDDVRNKLLYDHAYAVSLSRMASWLWMDCMVLFRTFWVMVTGRGH